MNRAEYVDYFLTNDEWRREQGDDLVSIEKDYAAPGKPGYVVREVDGRRRLDIMKWGFPTTKPRKRPAKEGELPFLFDWWTNARNLNSNMWKRWLADPAHRCLVPFTQFAEPKAAADRGGSGDVNWWFSVTDQDIPCFAGIWRPDEYHDRVYSFLTTEPNPLVAPKHPKAMPVILHAEDHDRWLHGTHEEALAMQAAYPSQLMALAQ